VNLVGVLARRVRQPSEREAGWTLTEVMASMTIMGIFMVMFTGAMLQMYRSSNKLDAVTQATSQLNQAVNYLDRQVRYASAIDPPVQAPNGDWSVIFNSTYSAQDTCTQLKLSGGVLSRRSWISGAVTTPPVWNALASQLTNPSSMQPFTFYPADSTHITQRLGVALQSSAGITTAATDVQTSITFSALNSSIASKTNPTASNPGGTLVCTDSVGS
jgi:prepilin-type N-terminal cleavage/methylation domain-containing protein